MNAWDDIDNAVAYDTFEQAHSMFRQTSIDLVDFANVGGAGVVVDLACGTGVTTEVILTRMNDEARVIAIDLSKAMLSVARRRIEDRRVTWVNSQAAEVGDHVFSADAIICNSAIWHFDMEASFRSAARALRPGGALAFNIGQFLLAERGAEDEARAPTLFELVQATATLDYGYVPKGPRSRSGGGRGALTIASLEQLVVSAGFTLANTRVFEYANSAEAMFAWLRVPIFADMVLPGLPHALRMKIVDGTLERFGGVPLPDSRWFAFLAVRT